MVASASIIKHRVMKKSNLIIVLLVLLFVGVVDSFSQKHIVRTTKLRAAGHKTTRPVKKEEKKRDGKKARYDYKDYYADGMARVERYDSKIGDNKYGFVDSSNVLVIPPKFYYASWFSEGLVAVALNGKYGFIDQTGTWAIPPKYDEASSFDKTVALVNAQWQIRVYQYVRFLGHPFSIR
jgi:conserved hypothetical protein